MHDPRTAVVAEALATIFVTSKAALDVADVSVTHVLRWLALAGAGPIDATAAQLMARELDTSRRQIAAYRALVDAQQEALRTAILHVAPPAGDVH